MKAHLGTYLLSKTWEKVKEESKPQRPWPSADFSAVARLDVPALGTSRIVLDKSSGQAMTWGIGLVEASMTHSNSPIILAGHRDSHMSFMAHLSKGDELKIDDIFLGPMGLEGRPENPKPGKDGTITSKALSSFPPNFSGCAS